jgi:hypothetical protein
MADSHADDHVQPAQQEEDEHEDDHVQPAQQEEGEHEDEEGHVQPAQREEGEDEGDHVRATTRPPQRPARVPRIMLNVPLSALPPNVPSIYIGFVHPSMRWNTIARTIADRHWGHPSHGQIVARRFVSSNRSNRPSTVFKGDVGPSRAIIHMTTWFPISTAQRIRMDILQGKSVRLNIGHGHYLGCTLYEFKQ